MAKDVIIACDFKDGVQTLEFLDQFKETKPFVKIGMELFYSQGPDIVRAVKARGHRIFLDLKLHDIPNTVMKAMAGLSGLDVDIINLHAAGTIEMMRAAVKGFEGAKRPLIIAVTQLTSTDEDRMRRELLIEAPLLYTVLHYAKNAKAAGLDGVVCSPLESEAVKEVCGQDFVTVTPGIRFASSASDDQVRITTPSGARRLGSDYIVVGRPITGAPDPVAAYKECVSQFLEGV